MAELANVGRKADSVITGLFERIIDLENALYAAELKIGQMSSIKDLQTK